MSAESRASDPHTPAADATGRAAPWRLWMWAALLVGLIVRGLSWWWLRRAVFCGVPSFEDAIHQSRLIALLTGGFPEGALPWGSPLYPYLAALMTTLVGSDVPHLLLAQTLIGVATLPLIAWAVRPLLSRRGCWIAALIYGLHPIGAFFEMRLQPIALTVVLLLLAVRLLFLERRGAPGEVLGGLLLGAAFLLRPLVACALMIAFIWQRVREPSAEGSSSGPARATGSRGLRGSVPWARLIRTTAAFLLLPMILIVHHASLPGGGPTWNWSDAVAFHRSLSSETWGAARATDPPVWEDPGSARSSANEAVGRRLDEWHTATFHRDRGLQRLIEKPAQAVGSLLHRAALLLSRPELPDPVSARYVLDTYAPALRWGLHLYPVILALAALGLWLRRSATPMRRLWPVILALAATNLLGTYSSASRWLLVVMLLPPMAAAIEELPRLIAGLRTSRSTRLAAAGAVLLLVLSSLDLPAAASRYEDQSEDLRYRAAVSRRLQDQRATTSLLQKAVHVNPENAVAHVDLGEVYAAEDLRDAARNEYEEALGIDPQNARALYNMSELLRGEERYAEAESLVVRLVRLHPRHPLYINQYGVIKMLQVKFGQARFLFEQALAIAPDYQVVQMNLRTLDEAERQAPTLAFPEEMIPPVGSPLLTLGYAAVRAVGEEDWATADSLTAVAVDSFPDLPLSWYVRGGFFFRAGRYDDAVPFLLRVVEIAPGRALTTEMAARALLAAGQRERAEALVRESLAQAADDRNRATIERMLSTLRSQDSGSD